jgi:tRNA1(Val) A37 N6-methylase TrmN6
MAHYTPKAIGEALSAFLPKSCSSILEPAVGAGDLLLPILEATNKPPKSIICLDIHLRAIEQAKRKLPVEFRNRTEFIVKNFLSWFKAEGDKYRGKIDCVVMNPPFAGRPEKGVSSVVDPSGNKIPIEWAFMEATMELLREGGRMLAVVPASIISSPSYGRMRMKILHHGTIRIVHELPHHTFQGVESKMYLLVWDKVKSRDKIVLMNHDLKTPEILKVSKAEILREGRFDFSFHSTKKTLCQMKRRNSELAWKPLSSIATLVRGKIQTPPSSVLHSTNCNSGDWTPPTRKHASKYKNMPSAKTGDILIKRVSRSCLDSFGVYNGRTAPLSDCVISIRPRKGVDRSALLFGLRTMFAEGRFNDILSRGTGCSYISILELREFEIPLNLFKKNPEMGKRYNAALKSKEISTLKKIENEALALLTN